MQYMQYMQYMECNVKPLATPPVVTGNNCHQGWQLMLGLRLNSFDDEEGDYYDPDDRGDDDHDSCD